MEDQTNERRIWERRVVRKLDWHIMPWILVSESCLLNSNLADNIGYLLNYL
jgi:hypothetical protein